MFPSKTRESFDPSEDEAVVPVDAFLATDGYSLDASISDEDDELGADCRGARALLSQHEDEDYDDVFSREHADAAREEPCIEEEDDDGAGDELCIASRAQASPKGRAQSKGGYASGPGALGGQGDCADSIYARLAEFGLLRKITDIILVKTAVPWHLRADATQEIHATWAGLRANPVFQRNQLANYAYKSGQHAALKLRRTIGAVVVIPGGLFRTGRDTSFMNSIGAALNPKDIHDYQDSAELSLDGVEAEHTDLVSEAFFLQRTQSLTLSGKQRKVAHAILVGRHRAEDVAKALGLELAEVERLINQVTLKLLQAAGSEKCPDAEPTPPPAPEAPPVSAPTRPARATHTGPIPVPCPVPRAAQQVLAFVA